ncbi:MAG: hypothetical protein KC591_11335 [Gemmatimonadetes bacterium]|nr:hypothetical protein [Gemmatimonadota bacterium]
MPPRFRDLLAGLAGVALWATSALAFVDPVWEIEGAPTGSAMHESLRREASLAYAKEREWFPRDLRGRVSIAWVADPEEFARRSGHDPYTVSGAARADRNEVLLNASSFLNRPERVRGVLDHELCHLLFARATSGAEVEPPRWLDEGVAMWRSGDWDLGLEQRRRHADVLRDAAAAGSLFELADLDGSFPGGAFFGVAYAQSVSFVEWLIARGGEDTLLLFLRYLDEDQDPEPAFAAAYGLSLDDAEERWRRQIAGGPLGKLPSGSAMFGAFTTLFGLGLMIRVFFRRRRAQRWAREEDLAEAVAAGEAARAAYERSGSAGSGDPPR